jgi:hypothetical protein
MSAIDSDLDGSSTDDAEPRPPAATVITSVSTWRVPQFSAKISSMIDNYIAGRDMSLPAPGAAPAAASSVTVGTIPAPAATGASTDPADIDDRDNDGHGDVPPPVWEQALQAMRSVFPRLSVATTIGESKRTPFPSTWVFIEDPDTRPPPHHDITQIFVAVLSRDSCDVASWLSFGTRVTDIATKERPVVVFLGVAYVSGRSGAHYRALLFDEETRSVSLRASSAFGRNPTNPSDRFPPVCVGDAVSMPDTVAPEQVTTLRAELLSWLAAGVYEPHSDDGKTTSTASGTGTGTNNCDTSAAASKTETSTAGSNSGSKPGSTRTQPIRRARHAAGRSFDGSTEHAAVSVDSDDDDDILQQPPPSRSPERAKRQRVGTGSAGGNNFAPPPSSTSSSSATPAAAAASALTSDSPSALPTAHPPRTAPAPTAPFQRSDIYRYTTTPGAGSHQHPAPRPMLPPPFALSPGPHRPATNRTTSSSRALPPGRVVEPAHVTTSFTTPLVYGQPPPPTPTPAATMTYTAAPIAASMHHAEYSSPSPYRAHHYTTTPPHPYGGNSAGHIPIAVADSSAPHQLLLMHTPPAAAHLLPPHYAGAAPAPAGVNAEGVMTVLRMAQNRAREQEEASLMRLFTQSPR